MKKLLSTTIAALSIAMVSQADFSQFVMQQDMFNFDNNGSAGGYHGVANGLFRS